MRVLAEDIVEERSVGVVTRTLADTQHAFDGVAGAYDRSNAANPILRAMRARHRSHNLCACHSERGALCRVSVVRLTPFRRR